MDSELWKQVDSLLQSALERPPEERDAFLRQACAGDEALEREVRSLLASQREAGSFLESPAIEVAARVIAVEQNQTTLSTSGSLAGQTISHYRIVEKLGAGGMGVVWKARDTRLDRYVALKLLPAAKMSDPERKRRFVQEARSASALNHPNIITIYDIDQADGADFIAMEYVPGKALDQLIPRKGLRLKETLQYAIQVADALAAAHAAGIVHRDLKPGNVMVTEGGCVKVLDFGLAKLFEHGGAGEFARTATIAEAPETAEGMIVGTVSYMSPEQAEGKKVDARTDIFSFGAVLYEMITGRRAFGGDSMVSILSAILRDEPKSAEEIVHGLPRELAKIVTRCLRKDPDLRYQHAGDLKIDLHQVKEELASGDSRVPSQRSDVLIVRRWWENGPLAFRPPGRRYLRMALSAVALIGLGFAVARFTLRAPAVPQWSGVRLGGSDMALNPRLSPDGHLLAFQAMVDGLTQVAVMKPVSGNWSVLTRRRDRGMVTHLSWSTDGALIYFSRLTDMPQGVYSVPLLGGEEHLVLENASQPVPLNDGTILVSRLNPQRQMQLFRFSPETGKLQAFPVVFSGELMGSVQLLRDGKHVLTLGRMVDQLQERRTFLEVDLTTAAVRRIPDGGIEVRAWTPSADGHSIIAATQAGALVRVIAMPLEARIPPQTLFTVSDDIQTIDAAADGSVFTDLRGRPADVVRLSPRGGPAEKIASLPQLPRVDMVVALPDGRAVVPAQFAGRTRLMVVEKGKDPIPLVNTTEETSAPMTLAGPHAIAFAIGPFPHDTIAIAETSNGQISGRISPGKGAITSLAATPDGRTIYFAAGGTIWSVPAGGGDARKIVGGEDVIWDPSRRGLVIARKERSRITLWRTTLEGGSEQQIPIDSTAPLLELFISPGTIHADGRMLVSLTPPDSWFNPPAVLDMASGRVTRLLNNGLNDYHSLAWTPDGQIVATQRGMRASIWKFTPSRK